MARHDEKRPIVGIDLGTTNSSIAYWDGDRPEIYDVGLRSGSKLMASATHYKQKGREWLVGDVARARREVDPDNTILSIKRHIGDPEYQINIGGEIKTPTDISAMILEKLKEEAESKVPGSKIAAAIISVPYAFNTHQIEATRKAGEMAGLNVVGIIHEPTAAALAFGVTKDVKANDKLLVFDLGGGTFDITIFDVENTADKVIVNVCATNGRKQLGGDDFDERIFDYVCKWFQQEHGLDIRKKFDEEEKEKFRPVIVSKVREAVVNAKEFLAESDETDITLMTGLPDKNIEITLTREHFIELCDDLLSDIRATCEKTLDESGLDAEDIDRIILVGGSTKMSVIKDIIEDIFGKRPEATVDTSLAVALGAATQCAIKQGFAEGEKEIEIHDVVSRSFGIVVGEEGGEEFTELIPKNARYPSQWKRRYTNVLDNQTAFDLKCYQESDGEAGAEARTVYKPFEIAGFAPLPKGKADLCVIFDVDRDGVISISVTESHTSGWKSEFHLDPQKVVE